MRTKVLHANWYKVAFFICLCMLSVVAVQLIVTAKSSAMFERSIHTGYFTSQYKTSGQPLSSNGIGSNNINAFVNYYKQKLNGSEQDKVMASFTIRSMLGQLKGTSGQRTSVDQSTLNKWEERVRAYNAAGLVKFNETYTFQKNTFYQESGGGYVGDIAWYYSSDTQASIVFRAPGGNIIYAIKRNCANPVGELKPLPELKWRLNKPVVQVERVNKNGWISKDHFRQRGTLPITIRYIVRNSEAGNTPNFNHWTEMRKYTAATGKWSSWSEYSVQRSTSLEEGESRRQPVGKTIGKDDAALDDRFCWRGVVNPQGNYGQHTGMLVGDQVCVTIRDPGCPPSHPYYPECEPPDPGYRLSVASSVAPWVEQGNSVTWKHEVTNHGPANATFWRCAVFNYDPGNINDGTRGEVCGASFKSTALTPITIDFAAYQGGDNPTLQTNGNTPLGANYCQRYVVTRTSDSDDTDLYSDHACTVVVGGKTKIGIKSDKSSIEPTETATFNVEISTRNYKGGGGYLGYDAPCHYYMYKSSNPGTHIQSGSCNPRINGDGTITAGTLTYAGTSTDVAKGDKICVVASLNIANPNFRDNPQNAGPVCIPVVHRPYLNAASGDVAVGNDFVGSCRSISASIVAWNKNNGDGYYGAGTDMAVFAHDVIQGFASGQNTAFTPDKLAFTNDTVNINEGIYGGNFNGGPCIPNYMGNKPVETQAWTHNLNNANGSYTVNGSLTLNGGTVMVGSDVRLYVNGDVYITGNIEPEKREVTDIAFIPNFTLVARNIYIKYDVSKLYGTYVAQPSGSGGVLNTCTNGIDGRLSPPVGQDRFNLCNTQLTVDGSVVAKKLLFHRTFGSRYMASAGHGGTAEVIKYNPLLALRQSVGGATASDPTYDSITTLPPIF